MPVPFYGTPEISDTDTLSIRRHEDLEGSGREGKKELTSGFAHSRSIVDDLKKIHDASLRIA